MNEILHQNAFNKIKLDSSTNSAVYIWVAIQTRDKTRYDCVETRWVEWRHVNIVSAICVQYAWRGRPARGKHLQPAARALLLKTLVMLHSLLLYCVIIFERLSQLAGSEHYSVMSRWTKAAITPPDDTINYVYGCQSRTLVRVRWSHSTTRLGHLSPLLRKALVSILGDS